MSARFSSCRTLLTDSANDALRVLEKAEQAADRGNTDKAEVYADIGMAYAKLFLGAAEAIDEVA